MRKVYGYRIDHEGIMKYSRKAEDAGNCREFYASWCPRKCGMMYPVVERIASRKQGENGFSIRLILRHRKRLQSIGIEIVPTFVKQRWKKSVDILTEFFQKKL